MGLGVETGAGGGRRVLIIEDNRDAGETLRELLELKGHAVQVAFTGAAGLALARELRPEIVLCDIGLPDMDGFTLGRALRADAATTGALRVALSGYVSPDDRRRTAEAGFHRHLAKPPDLDELDAILSGARAA